MYDSFTFRVILGLKTILLLLAENLNVNNYSIFSLPEIFFYLYFFKGGIYLLEM